MTKFNANNKGYQNGYPLFLGEDLGLGDTINTTYPQIEKLYQQQVSQIWNEFEINLTQDKMDMMTAPKEIVDLMVQTISWQALADSVASRSIGSLLIPYCSNPELESMLNAQTFFETIHNRAYSHIIKQTFKDPTQMLIDTYNNTAVLRRSEVIVKAFDDLELLPRDATDLQKRIALLKAVAALFALEAIAFMSSFAVTFAITETRIFQGIGQEVTLICRDECLHTRMDSEVLDILKKEGTWGVALSLASNDIKGILDSVVNQELSWADHLFSEGRQVVGLSSTLLKEYTLHMAYPVYNALGADFDYEVIEENPLPFMNKYIDSTSMMVAPQELQITAYKVGAILDDSDNLDLDFDM